MAGGQDKTPIRQSFKSKQMDLEAFAAAFHSNFRAARPGVRALFPNDLTIT